MPAGTKSDFKIYHEEFYAGMSESVEQNVDGFNAASNGAISLTAARRKGDFEKESFFKQVGNLVTRRDVTSVAAVADTALTQDEIARVKINQKIGPVANTLDSWRKIGTDWSEMSFILGQQVGLAVAQEMLNTTLAALVAAIGGYGATGVYDGTAGTATHTGLVNTMQLYGDQAGRVRMWVMHSKPYFDLVKSSIAEKIFEVAGYTIWSGDTPTLGRPVLVTDSPSLITTGAPDNYHILALTGGAASVVESEEREVYSEVVTGTENILGRVQGEYAYNLGIKGYTWDVANGGANPSAAAVATASNWDRPMTSFKSTAGAMGSFQ